MFISAYHNVLGVTEINQIILNLCETLHEAAVKQTKMFKGIKKYG
jgi:hypothetical protein